MNNEYKLCASDFSSLISINDNFEVKIDVPSLLLAFSYTTQNNYFVKLFEEENEENLRLYVPKEMLAAKTECACNLREKKKRIVEDFKKLDLLGIYDLLKKAVITNDKERATKICKALFIACNKSSMICGKVYFNYKEKMIGIKTFNDLKEFMSHDYSEQIKEQQKALYEKANEIHNDYKKDARRGLVSIYDTARKLEQAPDQRLDEYMNYILNIAYLDEQDEIQNKL